MRIFLFGKQYPSVKWRIQFQPPFHQKSNYYNMVMGIFRPRVLNNIGTGIFNQFSTTFKRANSVFQCPFKQVQTRQRTQLQ